jgi:hypothetical protein
VLVSHPAGEEPAKIGRRYLQSKDLGGEIRPFDIADNVVIESTTTHPVSKFSP